MKSLACSQPSLCHMGDIVGFGYLLVSAFRVKYFRDISIKNFKVFPVLNASQMMF